MNKDSGLIIFIDSDGTAARNVEEAFRRLHIANPLRIFSSCVEALDFIIPCSDSSGSENNSSVRAIVLDQTAGDLDGLALIRCIRDDSALRTLPLIVYSANIGQLQGRTDLSADAFVRSPMTSKLIEVLDARCGLERASRRPGVGST